jgi:hypothetical protein
MRDDAESPGLGGAKKAEFTSVTHDRHPRGWKLPRRRLAGAFLGRSALLHGPSAQRAPRPSYGRREPIASVTGADRAVAKSY